MKRFHVLVAAGLLAFASLCKAHTPNDPPHQMFALGDLKLDSGDSIRDFSISYVTHGTLNANKSNAILMATAIGGNHHRIDYLIGAGKALDPAKYFIICTDAIGNGLSTSPSNSKAQPRMQFPKFNMRDMVNSQQRLVQEKFGIAKLVWGHLSDRLAWPWHQDLIDNSISTPENDAVVVANELHGKSAHAGFHPVFKGGFPCHSSFAKSALSASRL